MNSTNPKKPRKPRKTRDPNAASNIAVFIVQKYVVAEQIVWPRDMKFAMQLAEKYHNTTFWDGLTVKFQVNSMVQLFTENAQTYLKRQWSIFNLEVLPKQEYALSDTLCGEKYTPQPQSERRPQSVVEFCK